MEKEGCKDRDPYMEGLRDMAKAMGYDTIAYCWHCEKNVPVHSMDACCKCGAPFDSRRCEEYKFYPTNKLGLK